METYDWKIPKVHDNGRLPSGRGWRSGPVTFARPDSSSYRTDGSVAVLSAKPRIKKVVAYYSSKQPSLPIQPHQTHFHRS